MCLLIRPIRTFFAKLIPRTMVGYKILTPEGSAPHISGTFMYKVGDNLPVPRFTYLCHPKIGWVHGIRGYIIEEGALHVYKNLSDAIRNAHETLDPRMVVRVTFYSRDIIACGLNSWGRDRGYALAKLHISQKNWDKQEFKKGVQWTGPQT